MLFRLLLVASAGLASIVALKAEDWPRWGGVRGDWTWKDPGITSQFPAEGLKPLWKQPIGGGYGGISVVEGRAYVMDRQTQPSERERLLCFDAASGKPLWTSEYPVAYGKLDYGNGPRVTPTVFDGRVYTLGAVGHFQCVDAKTGELHWRHDLVVGAGAKIPEWGLAASPVIWKDLVIIHPGAKGGSLMAFHRLSGKEVWRTSNDPAGYSTPIVAETPAGTQLIAWTPENVLGISPETGTILWSQPYKVTYGVSIATPLYRDGLAFVTGYWEGSKAIRLGPKPADAKIEWTDDRHLRGLMMPPLYRDGLVFTMDKQFGLTCVELRTGKKLWDDNNTLTPRDRNPQLSLVWLQGRGFIPVDGSRATGPEPRVIGLNSQGDLVLARLTREGCHELSRTHLIDPTPNVPIWAHPAFAGDCVYARSDAEIKCARLPRE